MKELLEYLVKSLVSKPDEVQVEEQDNGDEVTLHLNVAQEDIGIIIGKGGQTIKAIRKLLITRAMAENLKVNLQLNEASVQQ